MSEPWTRIRAIAQLADMRNNFRDDLQVQRLLDVADDVFAATEQGCAQPVCDGCPVCERLHRLEVVVVAALDPEG